MILKKAKDHRQTSFYLHDKRTHKTQSCFCHKAVKLQKYSISQTSLIKYLELLEDKFFESLIQILYQLERLIRNRVIKSYKHIKHIIQKNILLLL